MKPKYIGSGTIDQLQCEVCGFKTKPYWDGYDLAIEEMDKHYCIGGKQLEFNFGNGEKDEFNI